MQQLKLLVIILGVFHFNIINILLISEVYLNRQSKTLLMVCLHRPIVSTYGRFIVKVYICTP